MFYINHQFNNNIVGTVCNTKEELVERIESAKNIEGAEVNAFYVSNCEIKNTLSVSQKIENGVFTIDSEGKPIFESIETEIMEEQQRMFEIDLINSKSIEKKISDFLSSI